MNRKFFGSAVIFLMLIALSNSAALAASMRYSVNTGDYKSLGSSLSHGTDSLQVSQFDPTLGTLDAVTVRIDDTFRFTFKSENWSNTPVTPTIDFTLNLNNEVKFANEVLLDHVKNHVESVTFKALTAFDGILDFDGTSGQTLAYYRDDQTTTDTMTDFNPFIGTNKVTFQRESFASSTIAPGPFQTVNGVESGFITSLTVTYDYTLPPGVVPLPGALLLLGAGLARLAVYARRRQ